MLRRTILATNGWSFGTGDLVPDVVLADRFLCRRALHFGQRLHVDHHQRAVHLPQAGQRVAAVPGELDMGQRLPFRRSDFLDDFERLLVDDLQLVLVLLLIIESVKA